MQRKPKRDPKTIHELTTLSSAGSQASIPRRKLVYPRLDELRPDPRNPRRHTRAQIRAIAASIAAHGFNAPILIDKNNRIIAGHGRAEAAKLLGLTHVPIVCLDHLSEAQARAYMLADNKLTDRSTWDDAVLAVHLKELSEIALDFDLEATGFELPEIDLRIQSLEGLDGRDDVDEFALATGPAVSRQRDLWMMNGHRLLCGDALETSSYELLLGEDKASAVFADPPYNLKIEGNVCGKGSIKHREFAMASGEMTVAQFADFLSMHFKIMASRTRPGALLYVCMDWRHVDELLAARKVAELELINLCIWVKTNGGMGSLYRSRHELVFVLRNGGVQHLNNVQLGRFGRNRTNVWHYPGVNSFARKGKENELLLHPTVKPVALVADAMLDATARGDIVLDPFLGSGTTILAAERTGRRCCGIEIDPLYVDTAVQRWERATGHRARDASGTPFAQVKAERGLS